MKLSILNILRNHKDIFISGEELSRQLGVTRAAIWKHMKQLQEEGYVIESFTKKGYRLLFEPPKLSIEKISSNLANNSLAKKILYFETIDSTNEYCKKNSESLTDGTIILSDSQSNGKGRFDRNWFSPKGKGIYCSIFLKPVISTYEIYKITLITCAAITEVLIKQGVNAQIKWPNDIYVKNKKIGGILTEMKGDMDRINYLVIGFGLNINQDSKDFPQDLSSIATSLKTVYDLEFDREEILTGILNKLEKYYKEFQHSLNFSESLDIIRKHSLVINKNVTLSKGKEKISAKVLNIGDNGELIIDRNGREECIYSGEISLSINQ
ncbi:MAG: biotin--[acetyl-CoA-carboxylase] ligase [Clostridiaceae bacterium]